MRTKVVQVRDLKIGDTIAMLWPVENAVGRGHLVEILADKGKVHIWRKPTNEIKILDRADSGVYAAFHSGPGGNDPTTLIGLFETFDGAKKAIFPNKNYEFSQSSHDKNVWNGPDGCGMINLLQIQP